MLSPSKHVHDHDNIQERKIYCDKCRYLVLRSVLRQAQDDSILIRDKISFTGMTDPKYRPAEISDIPAMQIVRHAVKENVLSNPALIPDDDYIPFITTRGKGWVCELNNRVVGFAIADLQQENIWALFVLPESEGQGIGKSLQKLMLNWYFDTGKDHVWLGTSPNTRAEKFYTRTGWSANGWHGDEVKFEITKAQWQALNF